MTNDLRKLSKDLKAFAKRCKDFKYTEQMLFVFLLCGILGFSDVTPTDKAIQTKRQEISTSIGDMRQEFKKVKSENDKLVKNYNLELIQLMEQGDQAVKSPWSNWQYGMNFFYNDWQGKYKGRGDKTENIKYKRDASSKFGTFDGGKYGTTALNNKVIEPISAVPVDAAVKPKDIQKTALNINLPKIGAPDKPNLNITIKDIKAVSDPNPKVPNILPISLDAKAAPFNNYSFTSGKIAKLYANQDFKGSTFSTTTSGSSLTKGSGFSSIDSGNYFMDYRTSNNGTSSTDYYQGSNRVGSLIYALMSTPASSTAKLTLKNANLILEGNTDNNSSHKAGVNDEWCASSSGGCQTWDGVIGIHTVGLIDLEDINGTLKGKSNFISMETWQGTQVGLTNVNTSIDGDENTLFLIYPGTYSAIASGGTNGRRISISGNLNAAINTNKNIIYSVVGVSGGLNIDSSGDYKISGSNNVIFSDTGYLADYSVMAANNTTGGGTGTIKYGISPGVTTSDKFKTTIKFTKIPEIYGDENTVLYFGNNEKESHMNPWGGGSSAEWKKSEVGIYQGEISVGVKIGEHLRRASDGTVLDDNQSSNGDSKGNNKYVENNVGILTMSGQRPGIKPSSDLGAVTTETLNNNYDLDEIHALEVNNADITFGKFSRQGIMLASKNGSIMNVERPTNKNVFGYYNSNHKLKDYALPATSSITQLKATDNNLNEVATGTIIAYSSGKWDSSKYKNNSMNSASSTLNNLPSEINIGKDVELSARYQKDGSKEYYPIAFAATDSGIINEVGNTNAYGYGSMIAYANNGGKINIGVDVTDATLGNNDNKSSITAPNSNGKITAVDKWSYDSSGNSLMTDGTLLYKNIGAYSDNGEINVNGTATINGIGAIATNGGIVNLNAKDNMIKTGISGGLYAETNGIVNFYGGIIENKDNKSITGTSENDHESVAPFYAKSGGKIIFQTNPLKPNKYDSTLLKMHDGVLITDTDSEYSSTVTGSAKYQGLENVTVKLESDNVTIGSFKGLQLTWDSPNADATTGSGTFFNSLPGVPKFGKIDVNGHTYRTILKNSGSVNSSVYGLDITSPTVNLSSTSDHYNNIQLENEVVHIGSGSSISGNVSSSTLVGQGLSMGSNTSATTNDSSGFVNEGTVNVNGGTAINGIAGMNVSYGTIKNETSGSITIDNGAGIYGTNGSRLVNNGIITVSNSGAGIVGIGTGKVKQKYGTDVLNSGTISTKKTVEIENHGAINVAGDKAVAIYAENNTNVSRANVTVINDKQLTVGTKGVGIAVVSTAPAISPTTVSHGTTEEGGRVTATASGGTDIVTGVQGTGIYAEDSDVNLTGGDYVIETQDKGVGIFASGNTNVTGTLEYKYNGSTTGTGMGIVYDQIGAATHTNNANVKLTNATNTTGGMVGVYTTAGAGNTLTNNGDITGSSTALEFGIVSDGANIVNNKTITLGNAASQTDANVGIYAKSNNKITNNDKVTVGDNAIGIYGYNVENNKDIKAGDNGVAIYTQRNGIVNLNSGSTITVGKNQAVGVYAVGSGQHINANTGSSMTIGDNSFGIVNVGSGNNVTSNTTNPVTLGTDAVYIYQNDNTGHVFNYTPLSSTGDRNYGLYGNGTIENRGNINFSTGNGNVGIYSTGGTATNYANIKVGASNTAAKEYGVGMATGYYDDTPGSPTRGQTFNQGTVINRGTIEVSQPNTMGMYAVGSGSKAINYDTINLSGSNTIGMYIDRGATGENWGTIQTTASGLTSVKGIYVANGSYVKNYGTINIGASDPKSAGIWTDTQSVANVDDTATGVNPTTGVSQTGTSTPRMKVVTADDMKEMGGITIKVPPRMTPPTVTDAQGNVIPIFKVDTDVAAPAPTTAIVTSPSGITSINLATSNLLNFPSASEATSMGMYVDTSGVNYTNPIQGLSNLAGLTDVNLFFGTEASRYTTARAIEVGDNILKPYNDALSGVVTAGTTLNVTSASLTWMAQPTKNAATGLLDKVYLVKIPYTLFAKKGDTQTYNFLAGLEQKYGQEGVGTREKAVFDKINSLNGGEGHILAQAIDEMKGHQYSNIQQRTKETGDILSQEFNYLQDEWRNPTKDNNKIKMFGHRGEYNTDTAGVVDYTDNAYGVAYVHENETVKLGRKSGWYAGAVTNRFEFKDLGKSKETQTMIKAGLFKTVSPYNDHNGSLTWTIAGEAFAGVNNMTRRYWIVDDTFEAKSDYTTYGVALKNEIGKDFRTSERTSIRPYGALNLEYGRYSNIKEDGPMALEVKGNDYFSVQPELGVAFNYSQPVGVKSHFKASLTAAYTNELGEVNDVRNKARLKGTTADYYELRGDKEDRKGNGKFDLNIGFDNTRFGVTVNAGYDTKGENIRGGIGFRAIY